MNNETNYLEARLTLTVQGYAISKESFLADLDTVLDIWQDSADNDGTPISWADASADFIESEAKEKITSLFFEGQQWTQRDYGTPYQAVRVWANGRLLGSLGYAYGYGSQFEQYGLDFLHENGLISGESRKSPAWKLREHGITLYTSLSHVGKRDLVKSQDVPENIARFATI